MLVVTSNFKSLANSICSNFNGALSGLRQFMANRSPLKMMKNTFYFISKALLVLKIFELLSRIFDHV